VRFSISGYSVSASFLTDSLIPYFELVNSIQSSTNRADSIPASVSKANFNLFVIPAKSISGRATPNPHFELSVRFVVGPHGLQDILSQTCYRLIERQNK